MIPKGKKKEKKPELMLSITVEWESFPVRTEMCSAVAMDQRWSATRTGRSATAGTTKKGFWGGRLPRVAEESHVINMIIIQQFT